MQNKLNRAAQFQPFDALKGFKEALRETELRIEKFFSDEKESLAKQVSPLKSGNHVLVKYYYNFEYMEIITTIIKIDYLKKIIYFKDTKIAFEDIYTIELLKK